MAPFQGREETRPAQLGPAVAARIAIGGSRVQVSAERAPRPRPLVDLAVKGRADRPQVAVLALPILSGTSTGSVVVEAEPTIGLSFEAVRFVIRTRETMNARVSMCRRN